jgi:hypothetical protein
MKERFLGLIFFFVLIMMLDINEETVFIVGAILTWFFLFDAAGSVIKVMIEKDISEEFYNTYMSLTNVKRLLAESKGFLILLQATFTRSKAVTEILFYSLVMSFLVESTAYVGCLLSPVIGDIVSKHSSLSEENRMEVAFLKV